MSGGSGGAQMPMASNQGQQMQNPQMGQQMGVGQGQRPLEDFRRPQPQGLMPMTPGIAPQSGVFGQPQLNQQQQQAFDQMRQSNFLAPQGPQGPYETPQPMPQMGQQGMMGGMFGGMQGPEPSFANQQDYDDFMAQGGMQGMKDRMAGIAGLFSNGGGGVFGQGQGRTPLQTDPNTGYPVGGQMPRRYDGVGDGMGMPKYAPPPYMEGQMPQQGMTKKQYFQMYGAGGRPGMTIMDDSGMGRPRIGTQGPGNGFPPRGPDGVGDGTGPGGMGFGFPRNPPPDPRLGFPPDPRKGDLPGRGMPPAYGPTKGPIDGRKLRDMMDIRTRRPVDNLPNALENTLPPSLKRPTQDRM